MSSMIQSYRMRPAGMSDSDTDEEYEFELSSAARKSKKIFRPPIIRLPDFQGDLSYAAEEGDLEKVMEALSNVSVKIDMIYNGSYNALMSASCKGHPHIAQYLLEEGADANFRNPAMMTPLLTICISDFEDGKRWLECVRILLTYHAKVNCADTMGGTPLMYASKQGHLELIKELVENGADINRQDPQGWTALFWAIDKSKLAAVELLITLGAKKKLVDTSGRTAFEFAYESRTIADEAMAAIAAFLCPKKLRHLLKNSGYKASEYQSKPIQEELFHKLTVAKERISASKLNLVSRTLTEGQKLDLYTFLTLSDEELETLGIQNMWHRREILKYIKNFHCKKWKRENNLRPWELFRHPLLEQLRERRDCAQLREGSAVRNKRATMIPPPALSFMDAATIMLELITRMTVLQASSTVIAHQLAKEEDLATTMGTDLVDLHHRFEIVSHEADRTIYCMKRLRKTYQKMCTPQFIPSDMIYNKTASKGGTSLMHTVMISSLCHFIAWGINKMLL